MCFNPTIALVKMIPIPVCISPMDQLYVSALQNP